ncbi:MAG TPA: glycosyltransferase family 39 protein, partial [Candidatus Binatia bacterium]|nr:glycosyltransferase family 39 protein [Candidatus Binatia bacterium]
MSTHVKLIIFFLACVFILFHNLGGPALFEPDEGRNAEKGREILLTRDWVTPHENFLPVLDKPVFSYWLIAISYKLFGISEWSARLPSALAGLGSLILVYVFAKTFMGSWEALWSVLILVSSPEFVALCRIVIFDMPLNFFITFSLCCFYWGMNADSQGKKRIFYLLMYAAMGCATLVKGPVGLVIPGMVISFYALLAKKWSLYREMDLLLGTIVFLLIAAPWYVWVEIRNPGYLRYFFWEEHFIRFLTPHFHRSKPWYYFFAVLAIGFIPWTFLLPNVIIARWKGPVGEVNLFLIVWAVLPFLFFSFSNSKLPHYVLPIYPPLGILLGERLAVNFEKSSGGRSKVLWLPALNLLFVFFIWVVSVYWPDLLPRRLTESVREAFHEAPGFLILGTLVGMILLASGSRRAFGQDSLYVLCCVGFALFFLSLQPIAKLVSLAGSSKDLAEKSASLIGPQDQVVIYGTYRSSLPFYLHIERPIWVVGSGMQSNIMGSWYVAEKRPQPLAGYGKVLFTFEEFSERWETSER